MNLRKITRTKKMNNKGELLDSLTFLIYVFIFAIGLFVLIFIIPKISNGLSNAGLNSTSEGANAIKSMENIGTHTINNGFLMLFVGFILSMMITSFLVRSHPIFLFMYIFFLAISILLAFYLGNAYYDMKTNPIFADVLANASFINLVMGHIAEIMVGVGILSLIIVFAKFSTFGGTQQF